VLLLSTDEDKIFVKPAKFIFLFLRIKRIDFCYFVIHRCLLSSRVYSNMYSGAEFWPLSQLQKASKFPYFKFPVRINQQFKYFSAVTTNTQKH